MNMTSMGRRCRVPDQDGMRYYDLYHGAEITPLRSTADKTVLYFPIEAHGYGAILAAHGEPDAATIAADGKDERADGKAPVELFRTNGKSCRSRLWKLPPPKPAATAPDGHGRSARRRFHFPGSRHRD